MKYETKRKAKQFLKNKWKWLLGSGIFLSVGIIVMLIGFSVTGWSFINWLQSPFATTTFIFLLGGTFLLILGFLIKKQTDLMK
ncbi:MAG: hypothetical protein K5765_06830 [Clostridia bacterium]|nr:hypothetical protein [Clostridia bacterium]